MKSNLMRWPCGVHCTGARPCDSARKQVLPSEKEAFQMGINIDRDKHHVAT